MTLNPKVIIWGMICMCIVSTLSAQETGLDKLKVELAPLSSDSARIVAHYKVASEIYKSTPEEAKEIANKGYQLAIERKFDDLQINLLNLLGVIDLKLNNFDESISTHFKVLRMREAKGDRQGVMLSFLNIGNVFNKSYDPKQAIIYYDKALVISKEIKDVRNQANISTNIGNIYAQRALDSENKNDVDQAIKYLVNTVKFCEVKAPDVDLYNSYILLSYLYLKNKDLNRSEYYTYLAINITEKRNFPVGICYARINRANIYVQRGQFELAEKEVARIKRIIKESKLDYLEEELSGDFEKVAKAVKEKDTDVVFSDKDSSDIKFHQDAEALRVKIREELREKYDTEKRELENQNLQLENTAIERESDFMRLLLGGTTALLLTFVLMMFLLKRKNALLKTEKENVELARDEIKAQAEKIQIQHVELVQADRFRSRIFSVVSHDLRAPIANFQVLLSISKLMDLPTDEIKKTLIVIGQEVEAASKMLDELLVWSSQQMNNESLEIMELSVTLAVEDCRLLFSDRLKLKELAFQSMIASDIFIRGDQKRFEFILRNIISNAIKFSFFGKCITLSHQETEEETIIAIADQGAGMDEEKLGRLQKRDIQESYLGTFQEKGAGIGLMLCHEFANRMGWNIRMESKIGLGSIFYICVPK